ncbi:MAG: hypothetical protein Q9227_008478 [Pyrenula ochraceoflavens]
MVTDVMKREEPPQKISKLAIAAETETDRYDTNTQVICYACQLQDVDKTSGKLAPVVDGIMKAMTFARQEEVKAWEQEFTPCEHTLCLEQQPSKQIESQDLGQCSMCDLKENLWLCLECGNLGCGRAQWGGTGGNSHALAHGDQVSHGVAVKLGSITPEGSADIYCYKCNEERVDPELAQHLKHWGINIAEREKTEKSLMEMQVEQNLKWDFAMTTEDGKELKPLFGPGFQGLKNIGNSCYLASILQCLFSLPEFEKRYYNLGEPPPLVERPAEDLETQLRKLADGLHSGRYSRPDPDIIASPDSPEVPHQRGLSPAMFKHLIGRGHEEFSTMRQQDSFEFLTHMLKHINIAQQASPRSNPVDSFRFVMEQKLQCIACKKVRYRSDEQDNISIPVPARRKKVSTGSENDSTNEVLEPVTFKECLDIFTAPDAVELTCSSCGSKDGFIKQSLFKTFPQTLAVNARRFELVNWVPTKLDIPVQVTDEAFDMTPYMSKGLQPGEEELPEEAVPAAGGAPAFVPNEVALSQLESMGFPRPRSEKALHATGNSDADAALNWCLQHMDDPDIDEPLNLGRSAPVADDLEKISLLESMGISVPQARKGLKETGGSVERAVDWVFSHPDDQGDFGDTTEEAEPKAPSAPAGSSEIPANFQLQSIVCHKGASVHAGHYVAFIRKAIPDEGGKISWVLFNDEKVVKAIDVEEMKKFAYVYFFRRT